MLDRRLSARIAKAVFFRGINDIDIYVEDDSKETRKLYAVLLSKAMGDGVDVSCVFPLGNRENVLEACRTHKVSGRRKVYVIDADIEMCVSSVCMHIPRLFVLPRYCIENFLISSEAASKFLMENSLTLTEVQAEVLINFDGWLKFCARSLRRLFVAYATAKVLSGRVRTISLPLRDLLSDDSGYPDAVKIEVRIEEIKNAVEHEVGVDTFDGMYAEVWALSELSDEQYVITHVSGKDYLFPLLRMVINKVEKLSRSNALMKLDLARHADVTQLTSIADVAAA